MARSIAILTLALTAALGTDRASAQIAPTTTGYDVLVWTLGDHDFNDFLMRADSATVDSEDPVHRSVNPGGQEGSPVSDHDKPEITAAIAIPNLLESVMTVTDTEGPDEAWQLLRDVGFGEDEADEVLILLKQDLGGRSNGRTLDN